MVDNRRKCKIQSLLEKAKPNMVCILIAAPNEWRQFNIQTAYRPKPNIIINII